MDWNRWFLRFRLFNYCFFEILFNIAFLWSDLFRSAWWIQEDWMSLRRIIIRLINPFSYIFYFIYHILNIVFFLLLFYQSDDAKFRIFLEIYFYKIFNIMRLDWSFFPNLNNSRFTNRINHLSLIITINVIKFKTLFQWLQLHRDWSLFRTFCKNNLIIFCIIFLFVYFRDPIIDDLPDYFLVSFLSISYVIKFCSVFITQFTLIDIIF